MSIAGSYRNIRGIVADRRRRRLSRAKRTVDRSVWLIEASDVIANVAITILVDARYRGEPSVNPQIGTRNFSIVCGPLEPLQSLLLGSAEDELVTVDVDIDVNDQGNDYVVKLLRVSPRAPNPDLGKGRKTAASGKPKAEGNKDKEKDKRKGKNKDK